VAQALQVALPGPLQTSAVHPGELAGLQAVHAVAPSP
jgi:hypothetical protein